MSFAFSESAGDFFGTVKGIPMRMLSGLFLVALIAILGILAYENNRETALNAWAWRMDVPLPLLIVSVYVLGMLSGWWMMGLVKRSWQRVTEPDRARA